MKVKHLFTLITTILFFVSIGVLSRGNRNETIYIICVLFVVWWGACFLAAVAIWFDEIVKWLQEIGNKRIM